MFSIHLQPTKPLVVNKYKNFIKIKCFRDRINIDTAENSFYIYSLGRYDNKHFYHYGDTSDLYNVEFDLSKHLPYYKKIIAHPIDYHLDGKEKFTLFLKQNKLLSSLPCGNFENIFTTNEELDIESVLSIASELFKEKVT